MTEEREVGRLVQTWNEFTRMPTSEELYRPIRAANVGLGLFLGAVLACKHEGIAPEMVEGFTRTIKMLTLYTFSTTCIASMLNHTAETSELGQKGTVSMPLMDMET